MPNNSRIQQFFSLLPGFFNCLILIMRASFFRVRDHNISGSRLKQILIVKLDAIGDFIVWLDAAKELRNIYPPDEYRITLLGNSQWADIARSLPYFDEIWTVDRSSFFYSSACYIELITKLNCTTFDVVLHPVYSREFLYGDCFVWASNARQKIGMRGDCINLSRWQIHLGERVYSDLVPESSNNVAELEHNALLIRWLGLTGFRAGIPDTSAAVKQPVNNLPAQYYVIIAGAGVGLRMWPTSRYAALAERIYTEIGLAAIVCGGEKEASLGKFLEESGSVPIINLTGKTTLTELFTVISGAEFVVGNETGGIHIAVAVGVPSVCITGGGHFSRFIPYAPDIRTNKQLPIPVFRNMDCFGCNWNCVYKVTPEKSAPCIESVTLESVFSAVESIISTKNTKVTAT